MRKQETKFDVSPTEESREADGEPALREGDEKPGVLIVDDEHFMRIILQLGLERNGFNGWLASSGQEAIQLYREHSEQIAVVLLDVCMPGMDGPQTLVALRQLNPEVRACFMSGNPGRYDEKELRQRGAALVIAKPFDLNELAKKLRQLTPDTPADPLSFSLTSER
jgi:CheY-like chemotaxis protein